MILAIVLTLAMSTAQGECLTVYVEHDSHGPFVVQATGDASFPGRMLDELWFQFGDEEPWSVNVADPDIESVTACPGGVSTIGYDTPAPDPVTPPWYAPILEMVMRLVWVFS